MELDRRRLLRSAAGGVAGATWWLSGRTSLPASASQQDGGERDSDDFDPAVHGFGFGNWDGTIGTGQDGEEFVYEPGDVSEDDVRRAIDMSWSIALSEAKKHLMTRIVYSWIGGNAATNGHCYGMSFSADQYFQDPSELPSAITVASEIPRPTGAYSEVGDRIRRLQTSQLLRAEPYWFAFLGLRWGLADHRESIRMLIQALDSTGTAGIALDGEANPHLVLATGYETDSGETNVQIYDPTLTAEEHEDPEAVWTLSVDRESGEILEIRDGYDSFLYHNPDMDESVVDRLIGDRDRVMDELSTAVFLGLETAGKLDIDVPDDVIVDRPDAEYADPDRSPYYDAAIVLGSPDGFEVALEGESGAEYSLDVLGLRDDELVLEDVVSDVLEEGSTRFRFTVDEAGGFVIDFVEEAAEGAAEAAGEAEEGVGEAGEAAEEGVEEAGESAEEAGRDVEEANDTNWRERIGMLAAAGGAAGLGIAYWLLGNRDGDGEDT